MAVHMRPLDEKAQKWLELSTKQTIKLNKINTIKWTITIQARSSRTFPSATTQ